MVSQTTILKKNHKNTKLPGKFKMETPIKCLNQKLNYINRMDNNCHSPDFEHAYTRTLSL